MKLFALFLIAAGWCSLAASSTLLSKDWSTVLPGSTASPANFSGSPGWNALTPSGDKYLLTVSNGTQLACVEVSSGQILWTFSDWIDSNLDVTIAMERVIAASNKRAFVLRGSFVYAISLKSATWDYWIDTPENATNISPLGDDYFFLTFPSSISVWDAHTGLMVWTVPTLPGSNLRYSNSAIAVQQQGSNANIIDLVVYCVESGKLLWSSSFDAQNVQFLYTFHVSADSIIFMVVETTQTVTRAYFESSNASTPVKAGYSFFVELNVYGYGVVNDVLYLQIGDNAVQILSYNYSTGEPLACSPPIGAVAGNAHLVGEPLFALAAFETSNNLYNLTGWNYADGSLRFSYVFDNLTSVKSRKTPLRSARKVGNIVIYNLVANWNGQMAIPTANGFHFVDGDRTLQDDSFVNSFPQIVLESIFVTNDQVLLTYGDEIAALKFAPYV